MDVRLKPWKGNERLYFYEFDPNDPIGNGDIAPDEINGDPSVKIVGSTVETEKKDIGADNPPPGR